VRVAVDAMGGDFGPRVTVEGAVKAAQEYKIEVLLVGAEELIQKEFDRFNNTKAKIDLIDAAEAIGMGEGLLSFRRKQSSSIRVGTQLVKKGEAEAFVSTGNTAAIVYLSKRILGALKGVEKPALSLLVPTIKGLTLLLDVGANVNCRPHHLEQFAVMGHTFMKSVLGIKTPRIGLMSVGEEETKGNELTKEAFDRLEASPLNFIGNVEGKDIPAGMADVVVTDGFTGNVIAKLSEGLAASLLGVIKEEIKKSPLATVGALLSKPAFNQVGKRLDYAEFGGAPLLGVDGVVIVGHGRSNAKAVKNAVRVAKQAVEGGMLAAIKEDLQYL